MTLSLADTPAPLLVRQVLEAIADTLTLQPPTAPLDPQSPHDPRFGAAARRWLGLWGAVLFETRVNVERVRLMTEGVYYLTLHVHLTDTALPELCRLAPVPQVLGELEHLLSYVRRSGFYQEAAIQQASALAVVEGKPEFHRDELTFLRSVSFARDTCGAHRLAERFNALVRLGEVFGHEIYGEAWAERRPTALPAEVDPKLPADHSLV